MRWWTVLVVAAGLGACRTDDKAGDTGAAATPEDADGDGWSVDQGDCDDGDATVNPGADEACNGIDDDCDGEVDEGVRATWYADADGDGWGDPATSEEACGQPAGFVADATDCDDGDAAVYPGADELCNGIDDDCDGDVDEDAVDAATWYADGDGDGWGDPDVAATACEAPSGFVADGTDCDDTTAAVYPGAEEVCDELDDDCDGEVDEGVTTAFFVDADGDGWGDPDAVEEACAPPEGYAAEAGDCDDGDAAVNPGAEELCNGVDDDCDGDVDEDDAADAATWYADADGDGYGDPATTATACEAPSGYVADDTDCDDGAATTFPGAEEACNGVDDDCDGDVDDGWDDTDADGTPDCRDDCPVYADPTLAASGDGSLASPYATIADAIALRGGYCDEIVLLDGTFSETVDYGGEDLRISSLNGADAVRIEAPSGGTVVTIASGESSAASLSGVTLSGGTGTPGDGVVTDASYTHGGALLVISSDPTITDCVLEDSTVTGYGGCAFFYDYGGTFSGNTVRDCSSTDVPNAGGGGLHVQASDGVFSGNTITDNDNLGTSADGGGIMVSGGAPAIVGNWIADNFATSSGGGIRSANSEALIANNVIVDNSPDGIALSYDDAGPVVANTIVDNASYGIVAFTCCGYSGDGPTNAVVDNVIVGSGVYGLYVFGDNAFAAWSHNDVYDSGSADYHGYADPTGTDGNLSVDPGFVGGGDYGLDAASPLVDAGADASSYGVTDDYDGTARPLGGGWDVGAFESH